MSYGAYRSMAWEDANVVGQCQEIFTDILQQVGFARAGDVGSPDTFGEERVARDNHPGFGAVVGRPAGRMA